MSAVAAPARSLEAHTEARLFRVARSAAILSVGLFLLALGARLLAVGMIRFPMSEGSAYYVDVARNLVIGRGFVIDSIWSYATPPLILPRPAFELWQPMASLIAAIPMAIFEPTFDAARMGGAVLGALIAPMAWFIARDAARRLELSPTRVTWVAIGSGLVAGIAGPFLLATGFPDSTLPFTVFAVAACMVMGRALTGEGRAVIGLGFLLGMAYLTRMEAVWVGMAFALLAVHSIGWGVVAVRRIAGVALVAALVAVPWLARNLTVFGTPFPGQLADNVFLTRNEQIFAWSDPPTLAGFVAQGVPTIAGNVVRAMWHNAFDALLVPAAPIAVLGFLALATYVWRRSGSSARGLGRSALTALLLSGAITFAATSVLFPVATLWGTFEHAAGPLLVGLTVVALLGADAFVAWLVRTRNWQRTNAWLAPLALVALTVPLSLFQLASAARQADDQARDVSAIALSLPGYLQERDVPQAAPVITDHPVWLSEALGRPALALPDEPVSSVLDLARTFGARTVVVLEDRDVYPAALDDGQHDCFSSRVTLGTAAVFVINLDCVR